MRFVFTPRWPFVAKAPRKQTLAGPRAVRFGADSCLDLALFGADEATGNRYRSDQERFSAALVAWRMLENASESKKSPNTMRMGMRSNPFAAARLFVRMLRRAGLEADIRKTPERATVPCVVTVTIDGKPREISMTMLRPVDAARVRRRHRSRAA